MVRVIVINTEGDLQKAAVSLNRMGRNIPQMSREGMRRWGKTLERDTKGALKDAGVIDMGGDSLHRKGIDYRQGKRSDWGYLFIRIHGVYLDSMRPHLVSVHRRRTRLLKWAKAAMSSSIRRKARWVEKGYIKSFKLYVKPHPFIASGWKRARPKLRPILKQMASRAIQMS